MTRTAALFLAVLASAAVAVSDAKAVELQPVNVASYPRVTSTAVVPTADSPAPQLTENGRPVAGYRALNLGSGKAIVLAVDRSRSMIGRPLQEASLASAAFVAAKDHQDQIAVHVFGWQPIALTGFSQATIDAGTALRTLSVDDKVGTALYDEVVLAAESLRAQPQRGRVLVLLTDGREPDLGSLARLPSAIRAARRAGVIVYPIALGSANVVPLQQLAAATGGRLYSSPSTASLGDVYRRIANELKRTWAVSYATAARPGDVIVVRAKGEGPPAERSLTLPGAVATQRRPCSRRPSSTALWACSCSRGSQPSFSASPSPRTQEAAVGRDRAAARTQRARRCRVEAARRARPGPRGRLQRDRARLCRSAPLADAGDAPSARRGAAATGGAVLPVSRSGSRSRPGRGIPRPTVGRARHRVRRGLPCADRVRLDARPPSAARVRRPAAGRARDDRRVPQGRALAQARPPDDCRRSFGAGAQRVRPCVRRGAVRAAARGRARGDVAAARVARPRVRGHRDRGPGTGRRVALGPVRPRRRDRSEPATARPARSAASRRWGGCRPTSLSASRSRWRSSSTC